MIPYKMKTYTEKVAKRVYRMDVIGHCMILFIVRGMRLALR